MCILSVSDTRQLSTVPLQVAFIAGVMYTLVGLLRLGWLTNFISHSVISGFMSGAAVIIGLSQVSPRSRV